MTYYKFALNRNRRMRFHISLGKQCFGWEGGKVYGM